MSEARDEILARVRGALARDPATLTARRQAVAQMIATPQAGPRPQPRGDLAARFAERSLSMSSTVDRLATRADVPAAVARYLAANSLPGTGVCWPELADLDWQSAGLVLAGRPAGGDDLLGITGTFCAIAETGTLMLLSGPQTAATTSLLPETHIAVVPASRIVSDMEAAFALLRSERGSLPRAVNFVSGPSRTGDIEQTIVLGAHGPYRVHLLILDNE
ncbi:lactate utilization protein C [Rhodocyclus tenuis]|uniref:Lactate utilization protein C n=2 Tax=Rhodocyclus TaxID=1064 RepID=A0A6L5JWQ0_RHOTE|nr:lactate utilization protein C [Rhodocyclus gracilis]MQY50618.1 lactate utilization protein C [Rhodocyclus gracilis]MRD72622.1 lactate utilization protein C [Rhodocyclus gracilis]NJA88148.1 lactate utilization protein C [Rhodocyclus gracilis]